MVEVADEVVSAEAGVADEVADPVTAVVVVVVVEEDVVLPVVEASSSLVLSHPLHYPKPRSIPSCPPRPSPVSRTPGHWVSLRYDLSLADSCPGRGAPRGRGGPGGGRGGKPGLGRKGPGAVTLEPHKHAGVYIAKGKEHLLVTRNMTPGESVYGEKRIAIATTNAEGEEEKVEYRVWNPFRSKLAAGILGGLDNIHVSAPKSSLSAAKRAPSRMRDWMGERPHAKIPTPNISRW